MSVEKLYEAVKSGRIKPDQLNDKGKTELRNFIMSKNQPSTQTPSVVRIQQPTPTIQESAEKTGYSLKPTLSMPNDILPSQGVVRNLVARADQPPTTEQLQQLEEKRRAAQRDAQDPANPALDFIKDNTLDAIVGASDRFLLDSKPGQFISRFAQSGLKLMGDQPLYEATTSNKIADKIADFTGSIGGAFVNPSNLEQSFVSVGLNNPLTQKAAAYVGSRVGNSLGGRIATEATRGAAAGAFEGGAMSFTRGDDPSQIAKETALGAAAGGAFGGAAPAVGAGLQKLIRTFRTQQAPTPQGPILALPAPRSRGNVNAVDAPEVINVPETGPRGLPAPNIAPPTRARVIQPAGLNSILEEIKPIVDQRMTPPLENTTELARWIQQHSGIEGISLNEIRQLPYEDMRLISNEIRKRMNVYDMAVSVAKERGYDLPKLLEGQRNRITPDLAQRARETQRMREVAGAGMPVRSMSDRYQGGVQGNAAPFVPTVGRRIAQPSPTVTPRTSVDPVQARVNETSATSEVVTRPRTSAPPPQQRGFVNTLSQSGRLSDEAQEALQNAPNSRYKPVTNADTVSKANARIAKDLDAAEAFVLNGRKADPEQIATGMRIIDELQKAGQTERAVTIAGNLAEKLTKAGQTVQAASIWNRLTPEGALVAARRKVDAINQEASRFAKPLEITPKTADDIMTAAGAIQRTGASKERAAQVMDIADRLKNGGSITTEERELVSEFVKDLQSFVKPQRPPRPPRMPREMNDTRIRDRVVSFMDEQERAAKERLRARGIQVSSLPLDVWADHAIVLASKIAKGTRNIADLTEEMAREFGESIRPHMQGLLERAQEILTQNTKKISDRAVSRAEQIAESYVRKNEAKLKPEDAEFIRNMGQKVSELSGEAQKAASMDLQAIMNGFEKAGIGRKISSAQYIAMLLNPVTQIRNVLGNELMYRLERLNRLIATPADVISSAVSGKPREITFKSGPTVWENFFAPTRDYVKGIVIGGKAGWRGVNPEGLTTAYDISGQAFRSKLNPLTYLEKTLGAAMKGFDYAAYNRAVNQRLREMAYLDAINNGVKGKDAIRAHMEKHIANLDDNIAAIAKDYGRYITLQDDTALSKMATQGRRILNANQNFGVGSIVLPFAKTPANLLTRAMEYSPAGFMKSIYQASEILRKPNTDLTRADVIQSTTRALLGTGMSGVGWWLADKGVFSGESPSDSDVRNLERLAGMSQFQLNGSALQRMLGALVTGNLKDVDEAAKIRPGDVLWQYEWAQPSSIPLAIGANISQERKKEKPTGLLQTAGSAAMGGLNTLFNTSMLQGLQEAFEFPPGEENKVQAFLSNLAKSAPSMFTPSIVNRINQYMDNAQRETYTRDLGQYMVNSVKSRVPGLAQQLPQRIDTLGQPQTRLNTFFDVFLSPSQRSVFKPSENARLVMDLLAETGDERVAPRTVSRYITGTDRLSGESKKINLTPEQYVKYQRIVGEETARLLSRVNPNLRTELKIKRVLDALDDAGEKGRKEMKKELGLKP